MHNKKAKTIAILKLEIAKYLWYKKVGTHNNCMSCSVKMVKKKWLRFAILLWPLPNLTLFHQNFDSTKILLVHPKF